MSLTPWKKLSSEVKFVNRWWTYRFDRCLLPNGKEGEYHIADYPDCVMIIPRTQENTFLLVRQFRYPHQRESIEFPCGSCRHGDVIDTYEVAAGHELAEEAGVAGTLHQIGQFALANSVLMTMCVVFFADHLTQKSEVPDDSEEFERMTLAAEEIDEKIRSGEIWDGTTISAWALYKLHLV